jgi:hypothetical protein
MAQRSLKSFFSPVSSIDQGWLTTRKGKNGKPLKEKNEGNAIASKQAQATQDWLTDREKKVCRYRIQDMLSTCKSNL